jgi:hypothetical protein
MWSPYGAGTRGALSFRGVIRDTFLPNSKPYHFAFSASFFPGVARMEDYLPASRERPKLQVWTDRLHCSDGIDNEINILFDSFLGAFVSPSTMHIGYPRQLCTLLSHLPFHTCEIYMRDPLNILNLSQIFPNRLGILRQIKTRVKLQS